MPALLDRLMAARTSVLLLVMVAVSAVAILGAAFVTALVPAEPAAMLRIA